MARTKIDSNSKVIIVEVFIENKGSKKKLKMALDTGATYVLISWEMARALNLEPAVSEKRIEIITASGTERAPLLTVDSVSVLDMKAERVDVLVHDLPPKSYVDGLLGLSYLRNFNISLNFKEGVLVIE